MLTVQLTKVHDTQAVLTFSAMVWGPVAQATTVSLLLQAKHSNRKLSPCLTNGWWWWWWSGERGGYRSWIVYCYGRNDQQHNSVGLHEYHHVFTVCGTK